MGGGVGMKMNGTKKGKCPLTKRAFMFKRRVLLAKEESGHDWSSLTKWGKGK